MSTSNTITKTDLQNIINAIFPATTEDMTQAQIDAFVNSLSCIGINAVDYIVEKGTSGKWLYRKWTSGRYEAWYDSGSTTVTCSTSGGNGWYRNPNEYTINLPTGLGFSTVRHAEISVNTDYAYLVTSITHANSTYLGFYVSHLGTLSSVTAYCSAYVMGSWS